MEDEEDTPGPPSDAATRRWGRIHEVLAVVVLSVTAILTAWCGFEASKWGGQMSIQFSQASSARIQSIDFASEARDVQAIDLTIYELWLQARADDDAAFADYIQQRFTPEFAVAFAAWQAGGEQLRSPFAEPSYVVAGSAEAAAASARADDLFQSALVSNQRGDDYTLLTVMFALVLFFVAISERMRARWSRWFLLGLGMAIAVGGATILATFPILV